MAVTNMYYQEVKMRSAFDSCFSSPFDFISREGGYFLGRSSLSLCNFCWMLFSFSAVYILYYIVTHSTSVLRVCMYVCVRADTFTRYQAAEGTSIVSF